jgi:hypothetical protein
MHLFGFAVPMDGPATASRQMLRLRQTLVLPRNRSAVFRSQQRVARSHRSVRVFSKKGPSPSHAEGMARVTTELQLIREGFQEVKGRLDKLDSKLDAFMLALLVAAIGIIGVLLSK